MISSLLADRAERLGDRTAVRSPEGDLTYAGLAGRAARVAGGLRELGVEPGDRVATMLEPGLDYLGAWWGSAWAGSVEVPVNNDYRGEFLAHVLRQSGASVLVLHARWLERLAGLDLPDLRQVVVCGSDAGPVPAPLPGVSVHRFEDLLAGPEAARARREESDLVYIMFTSGTTGPSKGVMQPNRTALAGNVVPWVDLLDITEADVAYSMFPIFHVTARSSVISTAFWAGASVELRNGFSVRGFWDDVRASGATWFGYMGALIHLLHAQPPRPDDADNAVRVAFGAAAPPAIMEDFERRFGLHLVEVYGGTELGLATASRPGRRVPGTMGRPLPHHQVEVHDEFDNPCPPGVRGEIVTRPAEPLALFGGYWGMPEATLHAFRNLWFHTGDGGYLTSGGELVFTDRIKDTIRRRGENISSFEVERAVQHHPAVLECAAYAVPAEITEDEVMIAVVARPGQAVDPAELFRFCVETMPRFTVPRYLRLLDELPKTPSGRVQKFRLRAEGVAPGSADRERLGVTVPRR